jgi:FMN phosphatase YigB (HAD superfamily)
VKQALEMLRTRAGHTVFVGDNPLKDFIRPNQMGLITIRVLTGEFAGYAYPSIEHAAHYAISSAAMLSGLLIGGSSLNGSANGAHLAAHKSSKAHA